MEALFSAPERLRPQQVPASKTALYLASVKMYLPQKETSAGLYLGSQFKFFVSSRECLLQARTHTTQMVHQFQKSLSSAESDALIATVVASL